jgi:hypothetical protein
LGSDGVVVGLNEGRGGAWIPARGGRIETRDLQRPRNE